MICLLNSAGQFVRGQSGGIICPAGGGPIGALSSSFGGGGGHVAVVVVGGVLIWRPRASQPARDQDDDESWPRRLRDFGAGARWQM